MSYKLSLGNQTLTEEPLWGRSAISSLNATDLIDHVSSALLLAITLRPYWLFLYALWMLSFHWEHPRLSSCQRRNTCPIHRSISSITPQLQVSICSCMLPFTLKETYIHCIDHHRLCYKNGGLAREQIRDAITLSTKDTTSSDPWQAFNDAALAIPSMTSSNHNTEAHVGLYFPRPEIVPNVQAGIYRFTYNTSDKTLSANDKVPPDDATYSTADARLIIESQLLSLRLRSQSLLSFSTNPGQHQKPRRIYLVGGGSRSPAIAQLAGEILGPTEGVWRLDVGENACALGAAQKALWSDQRGESEQRKSFERFLEERWREEEFARKVDVGYRQGVWEDYQVGVEALAAAEEEVLRRERNPYDT